MRKHHCAEHIVHLLLSSARVTFTINIMSLHAHSFIHVVISEAITGQKAAVIYMKM